MDTAFFPDNLIIPIPPLPGGVATAAIVGLFILNVLYGKQLLLNNFNLNQYSRYFSLFYMLFFSTGLRMMYLSVVG